MTTQDFIASVKERLEKATPGEWRLYGKHLDDQFPSTIAFSQIASYDKVTKVSLIMCRLGAPDKICMEKANAELILNCPSDLARLVKMVEYLQCVIDGICTTAEKEFPYIKEIQIAARKECDDIAGGGD